MERQKTGRRWLAEGGIPLLLLAILVFACYANSLNNAFVSDDISGIRDNPAINGAAFFWRPPLFFLRPFFVFIIHKVFGLNPLFFRLLNILFHLGSAWLAYFLMRLFFSPPLPFFIAAVFAAHPLLSEAVTWISGGPYSQYSFFALGALLFYILSRRPDRVAAEKGKFYFLSLAFFALALISCEKAIILPLPLIVWEISFGDLPKNWKKVLPFCAIAGILGLAYLVALRGHINALETQFYQERGMDNPLLQVPIAVTSYLQLIFWPDGLTLYHSEMRFTVLAYIIRLVIFLLFLGLIIYAYRRQRRVFFWLLFFLVSLLPTLTPFRISWIVAERYAYLGALGVFAATAAALRKRGAFSYAAFSLIIIFLSIRTVCRNLDWKNEDSLWFAAARTSPSSANNHNNLGDVYSRRKEWRLAIYEFQRAIELKPNYADAYHNLATVYLQMGEAREAEINYKQALALNPNIWQSYQNLAEIYFRRQEYALARECLLRALEINPAEPNLRLYLGIVNSRQEGR